MESTRQRRFPLSGVFAKKPSNDSSRPYDDPLVSDWNLEDKDDRDQEFLFNDGPLSSKNRGREATEELPEYTTWDSVDRLRGEEIIYRLNINRKKGDPHDDSIRKDGCYFQDKPFNVTVLTGSSRVDDKDSTISGETQTSPVLEIVQHAMDTRFNCRTKPRRLKISDLQISGIDRTELIIHSTSLRRALNSLIEYYPDFPDDKFRDSLAIAEPYALLMHHFREIEDFIKSRFPKSGKKSTASKEATHMKILHDFLCRRFNTEVLPVQNRLKEKTPTVEFENLWYLFRPGLEVYVQSSEDVHACVISSVSKVLHWSMRSRQWNLDMWCLSTDGRRIARITKSASIGAYSGYREVKALPICPVAIWDSFDGGKRRKRILERSAMYVRTLRNGSLHATYDGTDHIDGKRFQGKIVVDCVRGWSVGSHDIGKAPSIGNVKDPNNKYASYDYIYVRSEDLNSGSSASAGLNREQVDIPSSITNEDQKSRKRSLSTEAVLHAKYISKPLPSVERDAGEVDALAKARYGTLEINDDQLLLLYPQAPAFALSTKQWMLVSLEQAKPVESSNESINNLVLVDKDALQTIRALSVRQNSKQNAWSADFIEGKGSGQIILLHGPPGVGKTFTVESIATWLHRPLLALTVADIGTVETKIEQELMRWFDLAEVWNAVLLVDEADIFLEQRKTRDLSRNGLVSAFLRRMEYFKGLLFLTTNRVGQIDDAFMSRVHVAIGYEPLTSDVRQEIWRGFFNKVATERAGKVVIGPSAKKFVLEDPMVRGIELNGRDIRNALQTAITLAEFETLETRSSEENELVIVEEGHFRRVLQMGEKFQKYITSIRREDEAKRANQRGDRNDYLDT